MPDAFGCEPVGFRVLPLQLSLLTTSFGLLTLGFRTLAAWLIGAHAVLPTSELTTGRANYPIFNLYNSIIINISL
jgi:hypothetical protein